ncbi:hypothetical protein CHISP_0146 [Chitinispirillum alkaliphilum]|nr:hypothetical protein CHISP_0146 [Chitinispirillum alkaliphilum]
MSKKSIFHLILYSCLSAWLLSLCCSPHRHYVQITRDLADNQRYRNAIEVYDLILQRDSANMEALLNAGIINVKIEQYTPAMFYLGRTPGLKKSQNQRIRFYTINH